MENKDKEAPKEEEKFILQIGGETLDITKYPPLTLRDKKMMQAEPYKVDEKQIGSMTPDAEAMFVLYLLKKLRPNTTLDEVLDLPLRLCGDITIHVMQRSREVDSPFSRRLTSLLQNTAGVEQK